MISMIYQTQQQSSETLGGGVTYIGLAIQIEVLFYIILPIFPTCGRLGAVNNSTDDPNYGDQS